jgi:hypothetical protein
MAEFGKLNFSVAFAPATAFPLDSRSYFATKATAEAAAQTADEVGSSSTVYYYGMTLVVVENQTATLYTIQPDKSLKEVGSVPVGDDKTIEVIDGKVRIKGATDATAGQQLRIGTEGAVEWFTPDTSTVEGLSATVAGHTQDIKNLQSNKADKATTLKGYGITDAMTSTEVTEAIKQAVSASGHAHFEVAESAPSPETAKDNVLYLVMNPNTQHYDIYAKVDDAVVLLDDTTVDLSAYSTTEQMNQAIQTAADKKVDKVEGQRLMTDAEGTKLAGIEDGAQANKIESVSEEFAISPEKQLSVKAIAQDKVTGLPDALKGKVNVEPGKGLSSNDYTQTEKEKLAGITSGAQVNVLESVSVNGQALDVEGKGVDIPLATAGAAGVVAGSDKENFVKVLEDGTMEMNSVNISKLTQTPGDTLILDGGSASV